jgi:hypothetical protein
MLWKHLVERFRQVVGRLFHGIANPASVKLPTPMSSDPFAVGSFVRRSEKWAIFSDVDGSEPPSIVRCGNCILHRQFLLASFAEA